MAFMVTFILFHIPATEPMVADSKFSIILLERTPIIGSLAASSTQALERIDEILLMYEHLTKQIRSSRYALTGFNFPLPSFENEKYLQNRYEISKQICESTNIYDARGTVDTLTRRLKKWKKIK